MINKPAKNKKEEEIKKKVLMKEVYGNN